MNVRTFVHFRQMRILSVLLIVASAAVFAAASDYSPYLSPLPHHAALSTRDSDPRGA